MKKVLRNCFFVCLGLLIFSSCATSRQALKPAPDPAGSGNSSRSVEASTEADFALGPGDKISVNVWRYDDLSREVMIDPSGNVYLPLIGKVKAARMTVPALREEITLQLSKYIIEPVVDIGVILLRSQKVHILGEVEHPGVLELADRIPVWEAISSVGGFTQDANENNILLIRVVDGEAKVTAVNMNLKKLLDSDGAFQNPYLLNGDLVYAPPRRIADIQRFMTRLNAIISPIVSVERAIIMGPQVIDALQGRSPSEVIVP